MSHEGDFNFVDADAGEESDESASLSGFYAQTHAADRRARRRIDVKTQMQARQAGRKPSSGSASGLREQRKQSQAQMQTQLYPLHPYAYAGAFGCSSPDPYPTGNDYDMTLAYHHHHHLTATASSPRKYSGAELALTTSISPPSPGDFPLSSPSPDIQASPLRAASAILYGSEDDHSQSHHAHAHALGGLGPRYNPDGRYSPLEQSAALHASSSSQQGHSTSTRLFESDSAYPGPAAFVDGDEFDVVDADVVDEETRRDVEEGRTKSKRRLSGAALARVLERRRQEWVAYYGDENADAGIDGHEIEVGERRGEVGEEMHEGGRGCYGFGTGFGSGEKAGRVVENKEDESEDVARCFDLRLSSRLFRRQRQQRVSRPQSQVLPTPSADFNFDFSQDVNGDQGFDADADAPLTPGLPTAPSAFDASEKQDQSLSRRGGADNSANWRWRLRARWAAVKLRVRLGAFRARRRVGLV